MRASAHIFYSTRSRRDYARRHGRRPPLVLLILVAVALLVLLLQFAG